MRKLIQKQASFNDYSIPLVQPRPVEPTQTFVEIPEPIQAMQPSSPLGDINKEPELESEEHQQREEEILKCQQDSISVIPMTERTITTKNKNIKQCSSKCSEIEISEGDNYSINPGNDMEHSCTIFKERSVPKYLLPADHGQQESNGSTSIAVEAEIYNH